MVLAVNCLLSDNELEKRAFHGLARFKSVSFGGGGRSSPAGDALVEESSVLILLTLQDLHPALQQRLFIPSLVVLLTTTANQGRQEVLAAEKFGVQRLLQVPLDTTDELADTCVALMLDLLRRTHAMAHAVENGVWTPSLDALGGMRKCRGLQLGLVGLGPVALGVARRAMAFGMTVVACDPMEGQEEAEDDDDDDDDDEGEHEEDDEDQDLVQEGGEERDSDPAAVSSRSRRAKKRRRAKAKARDNDWAEAAALGVIRAECLQDLLETSDVVSLHAPTNRVTAEMICEETLTWFKRGAILVNVTSGVLVDAVALKLALVSSDGGLGGAAIDCPEGATYLEAWVRDIPNLIVTPHVGFFSDQGFSEQRRHAASAVRTFLGGGGAGAEGLGGGFRASSTSRGGGTSLVLSNGDEDDGEEEEEEEEERECVPGTLRENILEVEKEQEEGEKKEE